MKTLGIIKENNQLRIVALTPLNVDQLRKIYMINIEKGAGECAGFTNEEYEHAGAKIMKTREELIHNSELIVTYSSIVELPDCDESKTVIACYPVREDFSFIIPYKHKQVDMFSLDLIPNCSSTRSMNTHKSVASINGYQAALSSFWHFESIVPLICGVGGPFKPAKVLVLGAGVAGLQATKTAKDMGAEVFVYDARRKKKSEVKKIGATFIDIESNAAERTTKNSSLKQRREYNQKLKSTISQLISDMDVVITTIRIPDENFQNLVSKTDVSNMKTGSVIVDITSDVGRNCEVSVDGEHVLLDGILIIGESKYFNRTPRAASALLGNNFQKFLEYFIFNENSVDQIARDTLIVKRGEIVNKEVLQELNDY